MNDTVDMTAVFSFLRPLRDDFAGQHLSTSYTLCTLFQIWDLVLRFVWLIPAFIVIVPFTTYAISSLYFQYFLFSNKTKESVNLVTPIAPYWLPFLRHTIPMGLDLDGLIMRLMKRFGSDSPVAVQVGWLRFTILTNPEHIQTIFKKSRILSNKPVTIFVLDKLLSASKKILSFYAADDSGMAAKARIGSDVKPEDRIYYFQIRTAHQYLTGQHLHSLNERFLATFDRDLDRLSVGYDWVEYPDLYRFLQMTVTPSSIETVFGAKLLELNPKFVENFWEFEVNAPKFLRCMPRWLIPGAYRVREKLIDAFKTWHTHANKHFDCSRIGPEEPEWEPNFGSKLIRTRQGGLLKMKTMDADARAAEDLGLMFGLNANVLPCIFWFIFQALRDPLLCTRLRSEVAVSTSLETGKLELQKLGSQPLMQSMHAEILRLYIAILTVRNCEDGGVDFAGYKLRKDELALIYSRAGAMNEKAWIRAGRASKIPLERFDGERFLVNASDGFKIEPNMHGSGSGSGGGVREQGAGATAASIYRASFITTEQRQFSMDGLEGVFLPFGGGDRKCPGRHYAKMEILVAYALLLGKFDVELLGETSSVLPNMGFAPFGSLPPTRKVPFRLRRRRIDTLEE